jgi:hypothetical protein
MEGRGEEWSTSMGPTVSCVREVKKMIFWVKIKNQEWGNTFLEITTISKVGQADHTPRQTA